jgi:hypothetical protein
MRLPTLSRVLGASVLLAGFALAQTTESSQILPVGQTFKNFTYPVYGLDGQLHYSFVAVTATGITLNRAEADQLEIDVFENGQKLPATVITSPKADLYVAERKMRTKNTVKIERADMEATAQECDFSATTKKYLLRTNVRVLLKHFDVGGSSTPGAPKSGAPKTLPPLANANAATPPAPGTPRPPTDDSILPSPGAYSDTNAAPLPPPGSTTQ